MDRTQSRYSFTYVHEYVAYILAYILRNVDKFARHIWTYLECLQHIALILDSAEAQLLMGHRVGWELSARTCIINV